MGDGTVPPVPCPEGVGPVRTRGAGPGTPGWGSVRGARAVLSATYGLRVRPPRDDKPSSLKSFLYRGGSGSAVGAQGGPWGPGVGRGGAGWAVGARGGPWGRRVGRVLDVRAGRWPRSARTVGFVFHGPGTRGSAGVPTDTDLQSELKLRSIPSDPLIKSVSLV